MHSMMKRSQLVVVLGLALTASVSLANDAFARSGGFGGATASASASSSIRSDPFGHRASLGLNNGFGRSAFHESSFGGAGGFGSNQGGFGSFGQRAGPNFGGHVGGHAGGHLGGHYEGERYHGNNGFGGHSSHGGHGAAFGAHGDFGAQGDFGAYGAHGAPSYGMHGAGHGAGGMDKRKLAKIGGAVGVVGGLGLAGKMIHGRHQKNAGVNGSGHGSGNSGMKNAISLGLGAVEKHLHGNSGHGGHGSHGGHGAYGRHGHGADMDMHDTSRLDYTGVSYPASRRSRLMSKLPGAGRTRMRSNEKPMVVKETLHSTTDNLMKLKNIKDGLKLL